MDPRLLLMVTEAYRHGKAIGAWRDGAGVLEAAGLLAGSPGVVIGQSSSAALDEVTALLAGHRVWDRFTPAL